MKKAISVTLLLILATSCAQAQLRKCTAPDGRVTYSDVLCASSSSTGSIKNPNGNSLDSSGQRGLVSAQQERKDESDRREQKLASASPPQECKFSYFSIGDEKGKTLAANAKAECLQNNAAKLNGQPISLEHYNFWRDHSSQKSASRQAAASRSNDASNAANTQNSINGVANSIRNKSYTCRSNYSGSSVDCR